MIQNLREDLFVKKAVVQQVACDSDFAMQVLANIYALEADIENGQDVKTMLRLLPKEKLKLLHSSLSSGEIDYRTDVLAHVIFADSFDKAIALEKTFKKLKECMSIVTKLLLTSSYFEDGSYHNKQYAQDIFECK